MSKTILSPMRRITTLFKLMGLTVEAGDECSLEQVADIFHLIQNAHEAVKKGLSKELRRNIYIREGDGWVELPASSNLPLAANTTLEPDPATVLLRYVSQSGRLPPPARFQLEVSTLEFPSIRFILTHNQFNPSLAGSKVMNLPSIGS